MIFKVMRRGIEVHPENAEDEAYIEDTSTALSAGFVNAPPCCRGSCSAWTAMTPAGVGVAGEQARPARDGLTDPGHPRHRELRVRLGVRQTAEVTMQAISRDAIDRVRARQAKKRGGAVPSPTKRKALRAKRRRK